MGSGFVRVNFPFLQLRERSALANFHDIANFRRVALVMGVELLRPTHDLLEKRVLETALYIHDHRLVVLVADHDTLKDSLRHFAILSPCSLQRRAGAGSS